MRVELIPQEKIDEPRSPVRAGMSVVMLEELIESIKQVGLLNPILVIERGERFEVIAGHRRLLATRHIGMDPVECKVVNREDAENVTAARLHENLFRQDLSAVEEACVYAELFECLGDTDKVAAMVKRSRDVVERRLTLLSGDVAVRDACHSKWISAGVAEELNKVVDVEMRHYLLEFAVREGATIAKVRTWRQQYANVAFSTETKPDLEAENRAVLAGQEPLQFCWLCGSDVNQWEMRVRMVHESCERLARKSAYDRIEPLLRRHDEPIGSSEAAGVEDGRRE